MAPETASPQSIQPVGPGEVQVARALLSVSDKTGIVEFARGLRSLGIELISTGGTARALEQAGIGVRSISELTGFPEIMDGRVKTLHPKLYASLLAVRSDPRHVEAARQHEVEPVDLVCVNLYPFERTAARRGVADAEVIENIDIGGPTMIRAAAKNFAFSVPVTSPESYDAVLDELRGSDRRLSLATREHLAAEAFAYTARYDTAIARWFQERHEDFPPLMVRAFERVAELPHGENPHQRAAYYAQVGTRTHVLSMVAQLAGAAPSFTDLLDLDAGRLLLRDFKVPACVIVSHVNPSGVALGGTPQEAWERAAACDPGALPGAVVCINGAVDAALARALVEQPLAVILARGYEQRAADVLAEREGLKVLDDRERRSPNLIDPALRQVLGGVLVQDRDLDPEERSEMRSVSRRRPEEAEFQELGFAWRVCRHVHSGAVVLAREGATVGIGAGQTHQADALRLALQKAGERAAGAVLASDAPLGGGEAVEAALRAGVSAIIQPGGSEHDLEVIEAVDRAGVAIVITRRRHSLH
jgi:phosphoribosylaminoimidazolecarboxamide formyltransferase/IMP cyclohydrolase